MIWICRSCVWGPTTNPIIFFQSKDDRKRYICPNCATTGWMSDPDAPIEVTEEIADKYAIEFQTNLTFIPPKE